MRAIFITGTDTGVGKTIVSGLLGAYFRRRAQRVIPQKWIQTGSKTFPDDIDMQLKLMGMQRHMIKDYMPYVCPYVLKFPASPHLAAKLQDRVIKAEKIKHSLAVLGAHFETVVVEGIGGALVPFNSRKLVIDIASELNLPVVIVAANKLGAINHTLMTVEVIRKRKMKIIGIVFNNIFPQENKLVLEDNIRIIEILSRAKILGSLPWRSNINLLHRFFLPIGKAIERQMRG
jgi:dethiobiotin synthetase